MIGDIGADVEAATAAGAVGVLVPTPATLVAEVDLLLTGPVIRALAHRAGRLDLLVSPAGRAAAELLPGMHDVITFDAPWSGYQPSPVNPGEVRSLAGELRRRRYSGAVIFTSFPPEPAADGPAAWVKPRTTNLEAQLAVASLTPLRPRVHATVTTVPRAAPTGMATPP